MRFAIVGYGEAPIRKESVKISGIEIFSALRRRAT
jgi:hypothetical protein